MRLEDMMHVLASFAVTVLLVLGTFFLYELLPGLAGGFVAFALWSLMLWSLYDDFNNDDPFD